MTKQYFIDISGLLRTSELKEMLLKNNFPLEVIISEDSTKTVETVEYDIVKNKIVGLVMPLNEGTGMPEYDSFLVKNPSQMKELIETKSKASYIHTVLAKPPIEGAPSFILLMFGTDNKFTNQDVLRRLNFIKNNLNDAGITVLGWCTDGDTRFLKADKIISGLGVQQEDHPWWRFSDIEPPFVAIQDTVHIGTKLRTRFLNKKKPLKIGKYRLNYQYNRFDFSDIYLYNSQIHKYL
jgi:hypothetical protein